MNWQQPFITAIIGVLLCATSSANDLTLEQTIKLAIENDPWLKGNRYRQQAFEHQAIAAAQLPDPKLSLGAANLPTDTFEFDQEPMTQLKVGITQQFPRSKTRILKQQQLKQRSEQTVYQREDRKAIIKLTVTQLWLGWLRQQKTIALVENNRRLLENLADIVNANYARAQGNTQQQDIIQAQVEISRLDDRLYRLAEAADIHLAKLNEWLPTPINTISDIELPTIILEDALALSSVGFAQASSQHFLRHFLQHPKVRQFDQQIAVSITATKLAKQQYKPQWGVNASYAWRDDDPMGNDRADFLSLGVTLDLPLFTKNRQDKTLNAAVAEAEANKAEKIQLLRSLMTKANQASAKLQRLEQRQQLYQTRLLKEVHEQVEASLSAYTNANADFNQVIRVYIAELNSQIEALTIDIDRLQTIATLNYLFTTSPTQGAKP